jgi:hypothetical protein
MVFPCPGVAAWGAPSQKLDAKESKASNTSYFPFEGRRLQPGTRPGAHTCPASDRRSTTAGATRALRGNPDITAFLRGLAKPPEANEAGWKDTVIMPPGEVHADRRALPRNSQRGGF